MPVDIKDFPYLVRIPWKIHGATKWNEICACIVEKYGLPGDKFISNPSIQYIDFRFKDDKDAMWFRLSGE